jgi:hypothetical protein
VHAAEHDRLGVRHGLSRGRELEGVTEEVGVLHDLVALVEVAEHDNPLPQRRLRRPDALVQRLVRGVLVLGRQLTLSWCPGRNHVAHRGARTVAGSTQVEGPRPAGEFGRTGLARRRGDEGVN